VVPLGAKLRVSAMPNTAIGLKKPVKMGDRDGRDTERGAIQSWRGLLFHDNSLDLL